MGTDAEGGAGTEGAEERVAGLGGGGGVPDEIRSSDGGGSGAAGYRERASEQKIEKRDFKVPVADEYEEIEKVKSIIIIRLCFVIIMFSVDD